MSSSSRVLCVGLACLDIVNHCSHYPSEDSDIRASEQHWCSGGNALNTAKVLNLIGRQSHVTCTLGQGSETQFVESEMERYGINHDSCVYHRNCRLPTSCVLLNTSNGSRTIVHYRNLPELTMEDFSKIDLSQFSWIHFEGRCVEVYVELIAMVREHSRTTGHKITVSVEAEKIKIDYMKLIPLGDVVIVSKDVSRHIGCSSMEEAVVRIKKMAKENAVVVCPWGELGAAAADHQGKVHHCSAVPPEVLVDTLGAGDTFNAGLIHSLSLGSGLERALQSACELAGAKCGMRGFDDLKNFKPNTQML